MTNKEREGLAIRLVIFACIIVLLYAIDAAWFRPSLPISNTEVLNQLKNGPAITPSNGWSGGQILWIDIIVVVFAAIVLFGRDLLNLVKNDK